MAKNQSRSMSAEFLQGEIDRTYIQLTPNRGCVENPPVERLSWLDYGQCEKHADPPFLESRVRKSLHPHEIKTSGDGDTRF